MIQFNWVIYYFVLYIGNYYFLIRLSKLLKHFYTFFLPLTSVRTHIFYITNKNLRYRIALSVTYNKIYTIFTIIIEIVYYYWLSNRNTTLTVQCVLLFMHWYALKLEICVCVKKKLKEVGSIFFRWQLLHNA